MLRIHALPQKLLTFIELQLFISLLCLPILTYWGLPISWMSPVSNLVFTPFLMIFLLLSSIIFLCVILSIPHTLLIIALSSISKAWLALISFSSSTYLISFVQPNFYLVLPMIIGILALHYTMQSFSQVKRTGISCGALLILCVLLWAAEPTVKTFDIPATRGSLTITSNQGEIELVDNGCFSGNPENFVEFTLLNQLRKELGAITIDRYLIKKPTPTACKIARALLKHTAIKEMVIPYWQEKNKGLAWEFIQLRKAIPSKTVLKRIKAL